MVDPKHLTYFGVFIDEVEEQTQLIDLEIHNLEKHPSTGTHLTNIQKSFKYIERCSATMGFNELKELTHKIGVFLQADSFEVNSVSLNLLKEGLDHLILINQALFSESPIKIELVPYFVKLEYFLSQSEQSMDPETYVFFDDALQNKRNGVVSDRVRELVIEITLNDQAIMKAVRAQLIQHNLKEAGNILKFVPSEEELENKEETFDGVLSVELRTSLSQMELLKIIHQISDIQNVSIRRLSIPLLKKNLEKRMEKKGCDSHLDELIQPHPFFEKNCLSQGYEEIYKTLVFLKKGVELDEIKTEELITKLERLIAFCESQWNASIFFERSVKNETN